MNSHDSQAAFTPDTICTCEASSLDVNSMYRHDRRLECHFECQAGHVSGIATVLGVVVCPEIKYLNFMKFFNKIAKFPQL